MSHKPEEVAHPRGEKGLMVRKEDARESYAQWLATPSQNRMPKTQAELAEQFGISRESLRIWKSDRDIAKRVLQLVSVHMTDKHADVVEALIGECVSGNVRAIEVYFKWAILTNMEFAEEKEKVSAFKRALEVFQTGRIAEMIDAIQAAQKAPPVTAEVVTKKPDFTQEVIDVTTTKERQESV
tara:strand:+ start:3535 stop:4083 length:549 start_codon:yes stop_codon:yes gene_type:complete